MATTEIVETEPSPAPSQLFPAAGRRLVVLSPTYAPEPLGTPLYAADTVAWLAAAGWDIEVVTSQPYYPDFVRHPGYGRATRRDRVDGVPVLRLPTIVPRAGRVRWRLAGDANFLAQGAARAAVRGVRRSPTVLSISPGTPVSTMVGAAVRRGDGRHVCIVHDVQSGLAAGLGMIASTRLVGVVRDAERRALDLADHLLALSEEMVGGLRAIGVRTPIGVLPLWSTVPAAVGSPPSAMTDVQFSGNLGRKQGLDQLVGLFTSLRRSRPSTTFTVRGAGPLRDSVQAQLDAAGLGVTIEPPVETAALPGALRASRLHVVPQLATTATHVVPSKIINVLATGGAVLAFASPASPVARMARECPAIRVVEPGDIAGAVTAACELLDTRVLASLRQAAQEYARDHHDRERLLRRLHEVLVGPRALAAG